MSAVGFLAAPEPDAEAQRIFDDDVAELGYVMNVSRLWAYQPATVNHLFDLMGETHATEHLSFRQRGILVTASASTLGDAYCSLAWGTKLASRSDAETAAGILRGNDDRLTPEEQVMANWARKVARDPNHTTPADVQALRDAGYSDAQIFGMTAYIALRIAFSTVNDALGARPDSAFRSQAPEAVLDAVDYGRPIDE
ncbi:MAG TPA: hypothetical protein VN193_01940 [Candidatus Angelobacter sp.]|nr:hypothetical protein [Candidatus Angelobacter sp.]